MTQQEIINGSKLIAEYLGWQYIPFDNLQGYSKPGWWLVKKVWGDDDLGKYMASKVKNHKDKMGRNYYVCRKHSELRFWNSLDALVPVIQKIEKDYNVVIWITYNGAEHTDFADKKWKTKICQSYDKNLQLSNNVFKVVVETLTECKTWKIED